MDHRLHLVSAVDRDRSPAHDFEWSSRVRSWAGAGFDAYARVLHAPGADSGWRSWTEAANAGQVSLHGTSQWHEISAASTAGEPPVGEMPSRQWEVLAAVLSRHTPGAMCYFAFWEGWGWLSSSTFGDLRGSSTALTLPHRRYVVFQGPLVAVAALHEVLDGTDLGARFPNFVWPLDRSWQVATEVDFDSTLIGGTDSLIESVLSEPDLEALRVVPDDTLEANQAS